MAPPNKMTKQIKEKEIESGRISLPASVRDSLFPHVSQNSKTAVTMVDEKGDSYDVVLKVRHNRTKPEIMAKGGKTFAQKRKLKPGDVLVFSRGQSGDHFKVTVQRGPSLDGFSARGSQPPQTATNEPVFGQCLMGSDIAPAPRTDTELRLGGFTAHSQPLVSTVPAFGQYLFGSDDDASSVKGPPSMGTLVLGLGGPLDESQTSALAFGQSLIGSDDPATVALGLGSLSAKAQPPPVALRLSLSIGFDDMPVEKTPATTVLELSLPYGSYHAPPIKPTPAPPVSSSSVGRIKAEVEEEGVGPTPELTLGVGPPLSAKFVEAAEAKSKLPEGVWVAEQELQEPKPPTALTPFSGLFLSLHPPLNPIPKAEEAAIVQYACMYPSGSGML